MTDRTAILSLLETPTIKGRIINVTHMLPYEIAKPASGDFKLTPRRGHGAMYSGIESLSKDWQCVHIGGTGPIQYDEEQSYNVEKPLRPILEDQFRQFPRTMVPVFLDDDSATNHYEGYCKTGQCHIFF
jgi:trehalose-6-phosphate synthase